MWLPERHKKIIALLNERQRLTTETFALELGVSRETVRRDLIELAQTGKLNRIHGGAVPSSATPEPSYQVRTQLNREEKQSIARCAAPLLQRGCSCFIDAGSTTLALARELILHNDLQIITNSIEVARVLSHNARLDVMLLGGRLDGGVPAVFGEHTVAEIARFHVDLALISPVAVDAEHGAMSYAQHEAGVARAMLAHARTRILLADHHKLGQTSRMQVCPSNSIDLLVTNAEASAEQLAALRQSGVRDILRAP
ncbi:DeoR/GlpR family DNA-binding transcription regulator [Roseateles koreensis]|uniref:DeoR/GlpR family DNA-binding transcription regulator n=1 Tax=Roseateles koreensis TaxID=2987526 RepID=A0ABT5KPP8_9BURK|nr:DeoR/GlpR family DNA-binding transcription regulator [Roseateles koreensis]MDC8784343.1 DeoR/GlpR family DNA-binding transcription regulator [Roseateles koreensis]